MIDAVEERHALSGINIFFLQERDNIIPVKCLGAAGDFDLSRDAGALDFDVIAGQEPGPFYLEKGKIREALNTLSVLASFSNVLGQVRHIP